MPNKRTMNEQRKLILSDSQSKLVSIKPYQTPANDYIMTKETNLSHVSSTMITNPIKNTNDNGT